MIPCQRCHAKTMATDTRDAVVLGQQSQRRRRVCPNCGHRWTTYELEISEGESLQSFDVRDLVNSFLQLGRRDRVSIRRHIQGLLRVRNVDTRGKVA